MTQTRYLDPCKQLIVVHIVVIFLNLAPYLARIRPCYEILHAPRHLDAYLINLKHSYFISNPLHTPRTLTESVFTNVK